MYTQGSLAASDYEGWVAWVGGHPVVGPDGILRAWDGCSALLEAVPHNAGLAQLVRGTERVHHAERGVIDWAELPHARVRCLELYAFRASRPGETQPLISVQAQPGRDLRWIQYKRTGIVVSAGGGVADGQRRTGIESWTVGYWDRTVGQMQMWRIPRRGPWPSEKYPLLELDGANHPCWPRPLGFGLAPHVLGLSADDVPPVPEGFGLAPEIDVVQA